jgi:signal recognition particle subunit SEC65
MDAGEGLEPVTQVTMDAEETVGPPAQQSSRPPVFRTPRDDNEDGPVRFRIASVAPVDDQPTLFHIGSSEGLNQDNDTSNKVSTLHRQSLGAWYQDSDATSSEEEEEEDQQQQIGTIRKHRIASTLKKHSLKAWFEGETPEQVLAYPKDEMHGCTRIVQELENQMSTALSSVIARLEQQEAQLKRHTKEFERLNEGDGVLGSVMKQLAKHDAWLTGDSVPPRNVKVPGSSIDEILLRLSEQESQLAQKIDKREVEEQLKDTKAHIDRHSIDVSRLMDSVQDMLASGAQADMTIREMNQTQGHFKAMLDGLQSTVERQDDDCRGLFQTMDALQRQVSGMDGFDRSPGAAALENLQTRINRLGQELARIAGKLDSIEEEIMPDIEPQPVIVREKSSRRPVKKSLKERTSIKEETSMKTTHKVELQVESVDVPVTLTPFQSPRQEEVKEVKELSVFEQAASRPTAEYSGDETDDSSRSAKSETFNIYTMKRTTANSGCWCLPVVAAAGSFIRDSGKVVPLKSVHTKKSTPTVKFEKRDEHQRGSDMFEDAREHA